MRGNLGKVQSCPDLTGVISLSVTSEDSAAAQRVPSNMRARYNEIVSLTDAYFGEFSDQDYLELCREMAATLARKRPSPIATGRPGLWACGIACAVGRINFLFDPNETLHVSREALCRFFGQSSRSGNEKAVTIMRLLKTAEMDPAWTVGSRMADNTMAWLVEVNGLVVDVRNLPREIQEEAFRLGLIPYVPE